MENKLHNSLTKLNGLHINIPEIIHYAGPPKDEEARIHNIAVVKAILITMRSATRVMLPEITGNDYLSAEEAKQQLLDYTGNPLLILKAPKSKPLVEGQCTPGHYYNKVQIGDTSDNILYGVVPTKFPSTFHRAILDLNAMIVRVCRELDGSKLKFTFHSRGEGILGDKILLWGEV